MARHKFKVGQNVLFAPGKLTAPATSRDYKIVSLLPAENGQPQYRIKGMAEVYERVAKENELSSR